MLRSFLVGAAGYPALEIITRGRTHYSMALAGGLSVMLMDGLSRLSAKTLPLAMISGLGVTAVEYACGKVWNRDYRIWDYRRMPLNLQGQICLPYTVLWFGMREVVIKTMKLSRKKS